VYRAQETISVIASFGPAYRIRPVRFRWKGRLVEVRDVTYRWQTREGANTLYRFAVTDGGSLFELSFNTASLAWKLEGITDLDEVQTYARLMGGTDRARKNLS
jgi:hypothetical protein